MNKKTVCLLLSVAFLCFSCDDEEEKGHVDPPQPPAYAYVDLGLPSGTLWATTDLKSVQNGTEQQFFSWGETQSKRSYTLSTYKYVAGTDSALTKYCVQPVYGDHGFVDRQVKLHAADDAAHVLMGKEWYTPTWEEWQELHEACDWTILNDGEVKVYVGKSKINGKEISFRAVGAMSDEKLLYAGTGAYYWSSTLAENNMYAYGLSFSPKSINKKEGKRPMGHCIRGVIPGDRIPAEAVDLGLPSGIKWASANMGASSPEAPGYLYAWGETITKARYDYSVYEHSEGNPKSFTKYCTQNDWGTVDGLRQLMPENDAAAQLWGNGWRMPTQKELQELMESCTWTYEMVNGTKGYRVTGKNGNSIYLPLAGTRWETTLEFPNERGFYWTSDLDPTSDGFGIGLFMNPKSYSFGNKFQRGSGRSIRPVHD